MRDKEKHNKDSYVIKNGYTDCTKDRYKIFQRTIATPINNHLKYVMHDNYCLYLKWKEDGILEILYEEKIMIHYIIVYHLYRFSQFLVSGDLAFFATIVLKNNMYRH